MKLLLIASMLFLIFAFSGCGHKEVSKSEEVSKSIKTSGNSLIISKEAIEEKQSKGLTVKPIIVPDNAFETEWEEDKDGTSVTGIVLAVAYYEGNTIVRFEDGDFAFCQNSYIRAVPGRIVRIEGILDHKDCFLSKGIHVYNINP